MADTKISGLAAAAALDGSELIEAVQGGVNVQTTTQDIADLSGGGGHVIEEEGTPLTQRTKLNFVGAGVTVTDDSGDDASVVTIPASISDTAYDATSWNGVTDVAPSKNAVRDKIESVDTAKQNLVNTAVALSDGSTIDLTAIKHTLSTSSATRTFTISYTGDDIVIEVTLSNTAAVYTFPATSLCVSEGAPSGNNTCGLSGVSGDKYIIAIKKIGSAYYVVCKNFGQ